MFVRRVAVIGTGLIGGSIGLGLRALYPALPIAGFDADDRTLRSALQRGAITSPASSPADAVVDAELVVLAVPVDRLPRVLDALARSLAEDATVTDVGSAKTPIVAHAAKLVPERFIGGHPMAGSERHGIEAADGRLFQDTWWVVTPTEATSSRAYSTVTALARVLGAKPVAVDPMVHDALVAHLSHVPQLIASALVDVATSGADREALLGLAGAGFRDVTRIASSEPGLWIAILQSNREAVLDGLGALGRRMQEIRAMIEHERWEELRGLLARARRARSELFAKPSYRGEPVALSMLVPDRPGVLAEVTTAAGEHGVNIEDLRIVHSTEGGRGRLELIIGGKAQAEVLVGALTRLGYHPERSGDAGPYL